jgi:hypothetical protein
VRVFCMAYGGHAGIELNILRFFQPSSFALAAGLKRFGDFDASESGSTIRRHGAPIMGNATAPSDVIAASDAHVWPTTFGTYNWNN